MGKTTAWARKGGAGPDFGCMFGRFGLRYEVYAQKIRLERRCNLEYLRYRCKKRLGPFGLKAQAPTNATESESNASPYRKITLAMLVYKL